MRGTADGSTPASTAVLTVPNVLSFARILSIPLFTWLIVRRSTTTIGLVAFAVVAATDWVDGYVARRTGQVSELGKIIDPVADRLAIAAGVVALVIRGVFPLWAALLILVRDAVLLLAGAAALARRGVRIDVRPLGKASTFALMAAIPGIAWGELDLPGAGIVLVVAWVAFAAGIVGSYLIAARYALDLRRALRGG